MKTKTYSPHLLQDYNEYFTQYEPNYDILNDFFFFAKSITLELENENYLDEKIEGIDKYNKFKSQKEFDKYMKKFSKFSDFILSFFNLLKSTPSDEDISEMIDELFYTFMEIYHDDYKKIIPGLTENTADVIQFIMEKYDIPMDQNKSNEQFQAEIAAKIGENFSVLFLTLLQMFYKLENHADDMDEFSVKTSFSLLIIFIFNISLGNLNGSSQQPIQSKEPKIGRNDPCPCGSGKKYKKCCME